MSTKNVLTGLMILVLVSMLVSACGGQQATPTIPTVDANVIYTQAAQTVQADLAKTEVVVPTEAATVTPAPTSTIDPTNAAIMTATIKAVQPGNATNSTATPTGKAGTVGQATATKVSLPTATSAVVAAPKKNTGDKAELNSQSPKDGVQIQKNASFDMTIVLKNTGTTTWSTGYTLKYYAGERFDSPADFNMPTEVKPGELARLEFTLTAPDSTGKKRIIWAVQNADGVNFYELWLDVEVTD